MSRTTGSLKHFKGASKDGIKVSAVAALLGDRRWLSMKNQWL
jgi:hypothetical protein